MLEDPPAGGCEPFKDVEEPFIDEEAHFMDGYARVTGVPDSSETATPPRTT